MDGSFDFLLTYNTLVVLLGTSLLGATAGLIGGFAVLRGRALLGDGLSHAAYPGVGLAFLVVGARSLPAMLLGALVCGLIGVAIINFLPRRTRIREDAAIAIVLSVFYGAGVALVGWIQKHVSTGSQAGLDSFIIGKTAGIRGQDVYLIGGIAIASLLVVLALYKEFKLVAFDPGFARVQGWPALGLDFLLTGLIAATVVIGLPAVGTLLMAALLILPGATARFWTDRLGLMLILATLIGTFTGATGTILSAEFAGLPTGPTIVLVGGALFVISMLLAPQRGLIARATQQYAFRRRFQQQHLLRRFYDRLEAEPMGRSFSLAELDAERSYAAGLVPRLRRAEFIAPEGANRWRLTARGYERAAELARAQRLWQTFFTEFPELTASYADLDVENVDRVLPEAIVQQLEGRLKATGRWPKGLPAARGEVP